MITELNFLQSLSLPSKVISYAEEQQAIDQIYKDSQALEFYINNLMKKGFSGYKLNFIRNENVLRLYFRVFTQGIIQSKAQPIQLVRKKRVLNDLRQYKLKKERRKHRYQSIFTILSNKKCQNIISQWQAVIKVQKKIDKIDKYLLRCRSQEFLDLIKQKYSQSQYKKIEIDTYLEGSEKSIYTVKLLRISFESILIVSKTNKLIKKLKKDNLIELIIQAKRCRLQDEKKSYSFLIKHTKHKVFNLWKQLSQQAKAQRFRRTITLLNYFKTWQKNLPYLIQINKIEQNNQVILRIYLQKRQQIIIYNVFNAWKNYTTNIHDIRSQNNIINTCVQDKYKYNLYKKYFEKLKAYWINNQIKNNYYQVKLRRKTFIILKLLTYQSAVKNQKILEYSRMKRIRKYFQKIHEFRLMQQWKIRMFRLKAYFMAFFSSIVSQYHAKIVKSTEFYEKNLIFKTIFSFKKQLILTKKQYFLIIKLNAKNPLRRWRSDFRLKRYLQQKQWFYLQRIIFSWKILQIQHSSSIKSIRQFKEQQQTQVNEQRQQLIEFQNIMSTIAKIKRNLNKNNDDSQQEDI